MKRKHYEVIKAWAEGSEVQMKNNEGKWFDNDTPNFHDEYEYRVKPPAPKWPETTLTPANLNNIFNDGELPSLIRVANAAIAHAIETGQVFLPRL